MIADTFDLIKINGVIIRARRLLASPMVGRSGVAFAARFSGVALSFFVSILFARALGVEQYGIFVFWLTAAGLVGTTVSFGIPTLVMRELAAARGANDRPQQARILTFGICMTGIVTCFLIAVGAAALSLSGPAERMNPWLAVPFLAFLVPAVSAWTSLQGSALLGYERVIASQLLALVAPAATVGGATILLIWQTGGAGAGDAMLVSLSAAALAVLAFRLCVGRLMPPGGRAQATLASVLGETPSWLKLGILLAINQVLVNAITQIDILMLGWLSTPVETANYHVASRISYASAFFFGSVVVVTAPAIARLNAAGGSKELSRVVQLASLLAFSATAGLALFVFVFGYRVLALFGWNFLAAEFVVRILVGSWVLHAAFGLNHTLLTMAGAERIAVMGLAGAALLNIALNALMVPVWGAEGAAVASLVSTFSFTIAFWLAVRFRYGFSVDIVSAMVALSSSRERNSEYTESSS